MSTLIEPAPAGNSNKPDPQGSPSGHDLAGLEATFRAHYDRMYRAAYRITGREDDAEDVLQTVFLRLLKRMDGEGKGETWPQQEPELGRYLHRAAINAALDQLRSRKRSRVIPLDTTAMRELSSKPNTDGDLVESELRDQLRKELAEMSPRAAEIFSLRYFEDFGNHEIAGMLGTSRSAIGVTLHRVRQQLRETMEDDALQSDPQGVQA